MKTVIKNNLSKITKKKTPIKFTKKELSAYNLCTINGCSQTNFEIQEPTFIGCYH